MLKCYDYFFKENTHTHTQKLVTEKFFDDNLISITIAKFHKTNQIKVEVCNEKIHALLPQLKFSFLETVIMNHSSGFRS